MSQLSKIRKPADGGRQPWIGPQGYVQDYGVVPGSGRLMTNHREDASGEWSDFAGDVEQDEFSMASGLFNPRVRAANRRRRQKRQDERMDMRRTRIESKADARKSKAQAKIDDAAANKALGESLRGSDDAGLLTALSKTAGPEQKTGMTTGTKVAIGIGAVLVLGGIAYVAMNAYKSKKS